MPRKETRWVQKDTYPTRAPVRKGGLVTGTLVSWVGQLEDTALCPPPGKALPVRLRPGQVARPLPPLLDPGTLPPAEPREAPVFLTPRRRSTHIRRKMRDRARAAAMRRGASTPPT